MSNKKTGLELLRVPFEKHQISKLPKPTKAQTDEVKADNKKGVRCKECGGWHHPQVVHLDYVGHAALTDRLLECDPTWNWEPMSVNQDGSPKFDQNGGLWIKLTVCNVTRIGYGHPDGKSGGDAFKETIGDALRNAAMRFGAALDLWHKGDLHAEENENSESKSEPQKNVNIEAAKDGHKSEKKQTVNKPEDLGEFICQIGKKYKGLRLNEFKDFELKSFCNWLIEQADKQGKSITGPTLEFLDKAGQFMKENYPHLNTEEEIPF